MTERYLAYLDYNCPFCFVLNRRIEALGRWSDVSWRGVEHAPTLPTSPVAATQEEQDELDEELGRLGERAPEITFHRPRYRPSSQLAIAWTAEILRSDEASASRFRELVFEAMWTHARDIADSAVLEDLAREVGIEAPEDIGRGTADAASWTRTWREAEYNRIPVLVSSHGAALKGLNETKRIDLFLRSGLFGQSTDEAC